MQSTASQLNIPKTGAKPRNTDWGWSPTGPFYQAILGKFIPRSCPHPTLCKKFCILHVTEHLACLSHPTGQQRRADTDTDAAA